jgi:hypothetical protein
MARALAPDSGDNRCWRLIFHCTGFLPELIEMSDSIPSNGTNITQMLFHCGTPSFLLLGDPCPCQARSHPAGPGGGGHCPPLCSWPVFAWYALCTYIQTAAPQRSPLSEFRPLVARLCCGANLRTLRAQALPSRFCFATVSTEDKAEVVLCGGRNRTSHGCLTNRSLLVLCVAVYWQTRYTSTFY